MTSVFRNCPQYECSSFLLRLVELADAPALLRCYSDPHVVSGLNADFCTSDFFYTTLQEMEDCIRYWLAEYQKEYYVRFAIRSKEEDTAIGTLEMFAGESGVLRIDLAADYESEAYVSEILMLVIRTISKDFGTRHILMKTSNTSQRTAYLERMGFIPNNTFRPGLGYHEYWILA